ncbi:MAG: thioredoxin fold domain-containing protein [Nitrospirae bacterium]|nr:thioredoxin fold domain-containing protein [Nitrospirota bacterium]
MKKVLAKTKDIVFFIKLYPLPMHPTAYEKAKSIVCEKSLKALENAFEGKPLPKATCKSEEVDNNINLAKEFGITGTPAIILPDGSVIVSLVPADSLIQLVTGNWGK